MFDKEFIYNSINEHDSLYRKTKSQLIDYISELELSTIQLSAAIEKIKVKSLYFVSIGITLDDELLNDIIKNSIDECKLI